MSLVVVTKDNHLQKRKASLKEEHRIDTASFQKKWRMSDATRTLSSEKIIGVLAAPIGLVMAGILAIGMLGIFVALGLFQTLAKIWGVFSGKNS